MTSRRLSTRMQETGQERENVVCEIQEAEEEVDGSSCGAAGSKKEAYEKRGRKFGVK